MENLFLTMCVCCGHGRILAPTAYIFFASALPVIAFGEQLERDTGDDVRQHLIVDCLVLGYDLGRSCCESTQLHGYVSNATVSLPSRVK